MLKSRRRFIQVLPSIVDSALTIEIGLEQAPFIFFSAFEHVKSLLIMGPNNTKNSSLKCDFLTINYEQYCQNLVLIAKKHQI